MKKDFERVLISKEQIDKRVKELAKQITLNGSYTDNVTGMYDDYILPGEAEDGNLNDAVYKFTLANDAVVTANVNGTNAIAAIYKAEDLQGNGPSSDNNYNGIVSGPSAPTTFFFDFNDGDLSDFTLIEKDIETANKFRSEMIEAAAEQDPASGQADRCMGGSDRPVRDGSGGR